MRYMGFQSRYNIRRLLRVALLLVLLAKELLEPTKQPVPLGALVQPPSRDGRVSSREMEMLDLLATQTRAACSVSYRAQVTHDFVCLPVAILVQASSHEVASNFDDAVYGCNLTANFNPRSDLNVVRVGWMRCVVASRVACPCFPVQLIGRDCE